MRLLRNALLALAAIALVAQPAMAQSILRDAETEALLHDMAAPLIAAAGLDPKNVDIVLVNDPAINAFVAGGQAVYINSGLIDAADDANQVQGVIAHELGHVVGGHAISTGQGMASAGRISILSLLIGLAAAAAGAGDAAMGAMMAGQRAAMGKFLAFSRGQENSADAAGAKFLSAAGISGKGSLAFFQKLLNQEFRYGISHDDEAAFNQTHPMTSDRITRLREIYVADHAWNTPTDPKLEARFQRVKAKLHGYLAEPDVTLRDYPLTRQDVPAHYARAYAYHKDAQMDKALAETDALIAAEPDNPYFLELEGQVLLESGHPKEAIAPLREATDLTHNNPLIAISFAHALVASEDRANYPEAERVLRAAVGLDRENPFAWYQLGVVYAAQGEMPLAQLASAEQQVMSGDYTQALRSARAAENGLTPDTPDWIRAGDIRLQAEAALERQRKNR